MMNTFTGLITKTTSSYILRTLLCCALALGGERLSASSPPSNASGAHSQDSTAATIVAITEIKERIRVFRSNVDDFHIRAVLRTADETYETSFETTSEKKLRDLQRSLCHEVAVKLKGSILQAILPSGRRINLHLDQSSDTVVNTCVVTYP